MIHHFKEIIITTVPSLGGLYASLETTNMFLKLGVGGLTIIYLCIRIYKALKGEYLSD